MACNTYYTIFFLSFLCSSVVNCTDPGIPANSIRKSKIEYGNFTFGTVVSYDCNPGYYLFGSSVLTCQPVGYWDKPLPECLGTFVSLLSHHFISHYFDFYHWQSLNSLCLRGDRKCHRLANMQSSATFGSKSSYDGPFVVRGKDFKVFQRPDIEFPQWTAVNLMHLFYSLPKRGVLRSRASRAHIH